MAEYSREQLIDAMRRADAAGDIAVVNELAAKVEKLDKGSVWASREAAGQYIPTDFSQRNLEQEFGQAVGERVGQTGPYIGEQFGEVMKGELLPQEAIMRSAFGRGALGTSLDVLGETISYGGKKLSQITPDNYEWLYVNSLKEAIAPLTDNVVAEAAGKLMSSGVDWWFNFKQTNPRVAEDLEGVVNIAQVYTPKALKPPAPLPRSSRTVQLADELYGRAERQVNARRNEFVESLIQPEDNKPNRLERQQRRIEDPKTGELSVDLSQTEVEMREILKTTEGVAPSRSLTGNINAIDERINKISTRLDQRLRDSGVTLDTDSVLEELQGAVDNLLETSPTLVGDAGKVAQRIFNEAERLIRNTDGSAASLLNVRRELDKWIKKQGKDSWDGNENAYSIAQKSVRDVLNKLVADAAPDVDTLESLRRQHLLLLAKDRLLPKAAEELDTKLGRYMNNILRSTGTSLPRTPLARYATIAAAGTTLGGAAFTGLLPYLAAGGIMGGIGYTAYRGTVSPKTKKMLSFLLRNTDKAMKTTKVPEMKDQLALDRAFVIEMMKLPTSETEDFPELTNEEIQTMFVQTPLKPEGM